MALDLTDPSCCNPLTRDQQALSIKKWYERFASQARPAAVLEKAKATKKVKAASVEAVEQKQITNQSASNAGAASENVANKHL